MEIGSLLDVFLFLSSLLLFFGSRPSINGVGMGFYHQSMDVEFPHAPDPPKGRHQPGPIGVTGMYSLSNLTQYPLRYLKALRSTAVDPIYLFASCRRLTFRAFLN
jgi:hypothetical protein